MKPLTPEEEALLVQLTARKDAYHQAIHVVAEQVSGLVQDEHGYVTPELLLKHAKQIRELLAPYDEAPVMLGEFVPASTKPEPEVVPFPYDRSPPQSVCPARGDGVYHQWSNVKAPWEEPHFICAQCNENWRPSQSLPEPPKWPPPAEPFTDTERYRK